MSENPKIEKVEGDLPKQEDITHTDDGRPLVEVGIDLHRTTADTWNVLVDANDEAAPEMMQRAGRLVRFNGTARLIEEYTKDPLLLRMSETAGFCKPRKVKTTVPSMMRAPRDIPGLILTRTQHEGAPQIDAVARMPFLGSDLKIHTEPGYHAADRTWLAPEVDLPPLPDDPHHEAVAESVKFLVDDWLGDFHFADQPSRAHALALAILPFVRPAIREATPLHLCNAPEPGSGKSLLAKCAVMPGAGNVSVVALEKWSSEAKRETTAWLLEGKPVIWYDNQSGSSTVDSALLSALLTEPSYSGRPMGKSIMPDMPIRCVWMMTGNNLAFTDELARRAVLIQFDPGDVRPSERGGYRHPLLPKWTTEHRVEIAFALLTLVQHWAAGLPGYERGVTNPEQMEQRIPIRHAPALLKGTFEEWSNVIGGILHSAGVDGFLGNEGTMKSKMDAETPEVEEFLRAIRAVVDEDGILISDLAKLCRSDLTDSLPEELAGERVDLEKELRYWLRKNKDGWHGGHKIVALDTRSPKRWTVEVKPVVPS